MVYLIRLCPKDFSSAWAMAFLRAKSKANDLIAALSQKAKDEARWQLHDGSFSEDSARRH